MADTVLARVPRPNLSVALTAFHRGGYGHVIRVIDPDRAPVGSQLQRAGIEDARLAAHAPDSVVLLVPAPQRATQAAALAMANGATDVELISRGAAASETIAPRLIARAGSRRDRRASRQSINLPPPVDSANATAD